jgi:hypothetical protein
MPIVRRKLQYEYRFTQIPNDWLRDPRLSLKAKGLLAQLLSHSDGWSLTIDSLAKANGCGRNAVSNAVGELEGAGYLSRQQSRVTNGKFAEVVWSTSEPSAGYPSAENPSAGKPSAENRALKKTISKKTKVKNTISEETLSDSFDEFWASYPRKVGRAQARKAFDKHSGSSAEILAGAVRMASDPNLPEAQFVPYPATWINREGWLDDPYPERSARGGKMSNAQRNLLEYEKTMRGGSIGEGGSSRTLGSDQPY